MASEDGEKRDQKPEGDAKEPAAEEQPEELDPQSDLAEALREKDQFMRMAQRAQADLVNYRKRVQDEQRDIQDRVARRVALRLIDVVDQLEHALTPEATDGVDAKWVEGARAIHKNFLIALSAEGFERFECDGEEFDPRRHEAMITTPSSEHPPDQVIRSLAAGYTHRDEVVRPARVEIASRPEQETSEDAEENGGGTE